MDQPLEIANWQTSKQYREDTANIMAAPGSAEHARIISFLQKNKTGWVESNKSYRGTFAVRQANFLLLLTDDGGVSISFFENNRRQHFYKKVSGSERTVLRP
jgi:hypothetical protein